ncbi:MAG: aromatic ring-hydroxylating dioxygenase subunit alpha [Pseudomonadota bacterium]
MLDKVVLKDALSAVRRPVAEAHGLPNDLYADAEAFAFETQRIFHGGWACIGVGADVPEPGDVMPIDLLGAPLLLVRDRAGDLKLYQNVCRHRGMILVQEKRNVSGVIRCPYHSWCYSLDGRLRATPHVGGPGISHHEAVDPEQTGLIPVRMGVFLDCIFADLSGQAEPFDDYIQPIAERWSDFADRALHHGGKSSRFTLDVNCNWKLAVENYCESYHLPWVHPGLNSYSRLEDHYNIEQPGAFSGQGTLVYNPALSAEKAFPDFPDLPPKWDRAAEYLALYPNVLFGVHRDHAYSIRLEPLAHDRTREHIEIYYTDPDVARSEDWQDLRAKNAALWKEVFIEDIGVVEGMQRGRGAPGFDGGVFSPVMDSPTHCFHDWVASRLG